MSNVQRLRPRFPLPRYPTGWFQVAWTSDISPGESYPVKAFGKDLVLFRNAEGQAKVLDAFCPHMGAHLGHGGKMEDGEIVCPFHAWKFNGEGELTDIPYAKKQPKKAKLACWPVQEVNGAIMVWHDKDNRAPLWDNPVLPEFSSDEWSEPVHKKWRFKTHNQEMAENMVDLAHFKYLHGTLNYPDATVEEREHILHMKAHTVMGTPAGDVEGQIEAVAHRFGFSVNRFTGLVHTLLIGAVIPVDDEYCDVRFSFTVKKIGGRDITAGVGKAFVTEISKQLEEDRPVWENKIYIDPPMLCDGDGPIGKFRRWCKQFYPSWYEDEAYEAYHGRPRTHRRASK